MSNVGGVEQKVVAEGEAGFARRFAMVLTTTKAAKNAAKPKHQRSIWKTTPRIALVGP